MTLFQRLITKDIAAAITLIVLGAGAWLHIETLPSRAAVFPRLAIVLLLLLSALYLVREVIGAIRATAPAQAADGEPFFLNGGRFAIALAMVIAYAWTFPKVGFFTTTFVFIPLLAAAIGMRRFALTIIGSAIFTGSCYVLFVVLLRRRLPRELLLELIGVL